MPAFAATPGQRGSSSVELIDLALAVLEQRMRTALPCVVVSFNPTKQTVVAQPTITENIRQSGHLTNIPIPPLADVPILIPRAGGIGATFPIQPGDECLVVFADMCLDSWYQSGGIGNNQVEKRRHDLSDGIAIFGLSSQPRALTGYSTSALQLRTQDGSSFVDFAKGQTAFTDNISIANGSSSTFSTNTGQLVTAASGVITNVDNVGSLNAAYFQSQLNRIAASQDCIDLGSQSTAMLASLNAELASIADLISSLATLIVVPTNLSTLLTWATNMIAPMALAHTNALLQQSALGAKLAALEAAIAARQAAIGCP